LDASKWLKSSHTSIKLSPPMTLTIHCEGWLKKNLWNACNASGVHTTAFLVNVAPHYPHLTVNDAVQLFNIMDFHGALGDFFSSGQIYVTCCGQRKSSSSCRLQFSHIQVWNNFRMQQHSTQDTQIIHPSQTVQALPPSASMPHGRCNTILIYVADGSGKHITSSGNNSELLLLLIFSNSSFFSDIADSCRVIQVWMIFSPIMIMTPTPHSQPQIYIYGQFFKFSTLYQEPVNGVDIFTPAPHIDMFMLNCHLRASDK
jgi:hypothetical protein